MAALSDLHARWSDRAAFLLVYVREAHAADEWVTPDNPKAGIHFVQPRTDAERCDVAAQACAALAVPFPAVVDGVDDAVGVAYGAWPDRMYVLDEQGVVVHRTAVGPFGFRPDEVAQALERRWGRGAP